MTESHGESTAVQLRSSRGKVGLVAALLALSGVLLVAPTLGGSGAAGSIGLVLAEAVALYVGYGALTRAASPIVRGLLAGD